MQIEVDLRKKPAEQANLFFEKSKKAKKKLAGLMKALRDSEKRLSVMTKTTEAKEVQPLAKKKERKWFEKFHWFESSEGFLVLAGRDAKSNETLVKNHLESNDLYFHAEIHGSPHCIVKNGQSAGEQTKKEAAQFTASFSNAWRESLSKVDVYSVLPEQVSKKAPSGESIKAGSFMIYGKRNWFKNTPLKIAVGLKKDNSSFTVISGPLSAVKKNSVSFVELIQGEEKKGATAKKILSFFQKRLGFLPEIDLDEIIRALPNGGMKLIE